MSAKRSTRWFDRSTQHENCLLDPRWISTVHTATSSASCSSLAPISGPPSGCSNMCVLPGSSHWHWLSSECRDTAA